MNELENRLAEALSARADSVQPEDLSDLPLPALVVPLWRRTSVMVAAAACLAVVTTSAVVVATRDPGRPDRPQPTEPRPTLELPADIGKDWGPAQASTPAQLDLDGDGRPERVRFLAEPSKEFDGRVRLQTTLSSDGSSAHGIVDLDTTIGLFALDPIDADSDGDEELVLFHEDSDGRGGPDFTGPTLARPVVFDLRDGLLVQAPAQDPDRLWRGSLVVPGAEADYYDLVRLQDFWIEDGALRTGRSALAYPAVGMGVMVPEGYRMDVVEWRLGDDGVLSPVTAGAPCVIRVPEGTRACAQDESDALPTLAPVAEELIGIGEEFSARDPFPFVLRLEAVADPSVVVETPEGPPIQQALELGGVPQVYTTTPSAMFHDGISLLARGEGSDGQVVMQVLAQDSRRSLRPLSVVGDVALGIGRTDDALSYRTWLTRNGALFTAVAVDASESVWDLYGWAVTAANEMGSVPVGRVCFDDLDDPSTARRC